MHFGAAKKRGSAAVEIGSPCGNFKGLPDENQAPAPPCGSRPHLADWLIRGVRFTLCYVRFEIARDATGRVGNTAIGEGYSRLGPRGGPGRGVSDQ